jgi:hypothetical protein
MYPVMYLAVAMAMASTSAYLQVTPGNPGTVNVPPSRCQPIGQTAKKELVFSMECKELPPPVPGVMPQVGVTYPADGQPKNPVANSRPTR